MTAVAILALRVTAWALAAWCLWLNVSALWHRGDSLQQLSRSSIAFIALAGLVGQAFYLVYGQPLVLVLALLLYCAGMVLAASLSWRGRHLRIDLEALLDRPDLSLPLVELAVLDDTAARRLAHEARRLLAERKRDALA